MMVFEHKYMNIRANASIILLLKRRGENICILAWPVVKPDR